MPASWPTTIKTFTAKVDNVDVNYAADINELQAEIVALETSLGLGVKGAETDVADRLTAIDAAIAAGITDHGGLGGLGDDDHAQYHNDTRGDARYPLLTVLTSNQDIPVRLAGVWNRLALGTALKTLRSNAAGTALEYGLATYVFYTQHTWGLVNPTDTMDIVRHKIKAHANQTIKLISVTDFVIGGTSVTYDMEVNGSAVSGGSAISATTADNEVDFADVAVVTGDLIAPDPTTVTGAVTLWAVTITLEHTITPVS